MLSAARRTATPLLLALVVLSASLTAQQSNELFSPPGAAGRVDMPTAPEQLRQRPVAVDLTRLGGAAARRGERPETGATVVLTPFADVSLVARMTAFEAIADGGYVWRGEIVDAMPSHVLFVVRDGLASGSFSTPTGLYRLSPTPDGDHFVAEIDRSLAPPQHELLRPELPARSRAQDRRRAVGAEAEVDVLVAYTLAGRSSVGGKEIAELMIDEAVAEANGAFADSAIEARLRIVHKAAVIYDENNFDWSETLRRLAAPQDGFLDDLHTLRKQHDADLVALLVANEELGGQAWLMPVNATSSRDHAFSITSFRWARAPNSSFAHEIGHNLGAGHDKVAALTPLGVFRYSHGYVNLEERWRTVMAYDDACVEAGVQCPRRLVFSNPDLGTGTAKADNARTFNATAKTVAAYSEVVSGGGRPGKPKLHTPTGKISDTSPTFSWSPRAEASHYEFQLQRGKVPVFIDLVHAADACVAEGCTLVLPPELVLEPDKYVWKVRGRNNIGRGPFRSKRFRVVQ